GTARRGPVPPRRHGVGSLTVLRRLLILAIVLGALGASGWWAMVTRPWAQPVGPLTASGTLEADEVLVGSEVAARIVGLAREGEAIQAGQVMASLDSSLVQVQIRQSDAATQQQLAIQADKYQLRSPISGVVTRVP